MTNSVTARPRSLPSAMPRESAISRKEKSLTELSQEPMPLSTSAHPEFLLANSDAYEWLVRKVRADADGKDPEAVLRAVLDAAYFATQFHPGRFVDGALENLAYEIGTRLDKREPPGGCPLPAVPANGRRRVMHVALSLAIGGHTSLMQRWMKNDESSCHSLVLINQHTEVPGAWPDAIKRSGGNLVVLPPHAPLLHKAHWLRELARLNADLVVWHLIWPDVVPAVAFATDACPPVAIFDHADHLFWLGASVADMLLNSRMSGARHSGTRRLVPRTAILPIPLIDAAGETSRAAARQALGIDGDQLMLLSVGRAEKYRPCGSFDFVATANGLLERHPNAHLHVVGESPAGIAPYLRCPIHERLHFVGEVNGPSQYRTAADLYLESFPFGSVTALLEAGLCGLPVVPACAPLAPMLVSDDCALDDILVYPRDQQDYVERADLLIRQPEMRIALGRTLRERLLNDHVGDGWRARLAAVYRETDGLEHRPRPIPSSPCCMTDTDIGLGLWHATGDRLNMNPTATLRDKAIAVDYHTAWIAREAGHYAKARRFAWRAVRHAPSRFEHWRLLLTATLGKTAKPLRKALSRA